jgi:GT2 family glycosyltransferase
MQFFATFPVIRMILPSSPALRTSSGSASRVLVSILNWNGAHKTLACLASLKDEQNALGAMTDMTVLVLDNGSREPDRIMLEKGLPAGITLQCLPTNLGFTGGHNVAIQMALSEGYDYIWLLNNDATVGPGTLAKLVLEMQDHPRCGAASPVLRDNENTDTIVRCLNTHDWATRSSYRIVAVDEARSIQVNRPADVWIDGTAVLLRVAALKESGPLDDRLFAYFDDNDISARLARHGWFSRCVFSASVFHEVKRTTEEYPPYLVYLLQRNELLFWDANTPPQYRRLLKLKMLDKALFEVNRQYGKGLDKQADIMLLGISDYLRGHFGAPPPSYQGKVPALTRILCKLSGMLYRNKLAALRATAPAAKKTPGL